MSTNKKVLKVRVVSALRKTFWYSKHLGKVFEVRKSDKHYELPDEFFRWIERYELVLDGERLVSYIRETDSEVVN